MLACRDRVPREGDVVHLVAEHLTDLSGLLRTVGERDGVSYGVGCDPRVVWSREPRLKVPTRDFR